MNSVEIARTVLILAPGTVLVWMFVAQSYEERQWAGSLLGFCWQIPARMAMFAWGIQSGWWQFESDTASLYSVPAAYVVGSSLLFGMLSPLIFRGRVLIALVVADALLVVWVWPIHLVAPAGVWGVAILCAVVTVPGFLLAHWTATDSRIYARASLQSLSWALTLMWLLPSLLFQFTANDWSTLLTRPWWKNVLYCAPLAIPAAVLINALYEFAVRGSGTAFPYDPPKRLVVTGVYRYVSNPMQIGIVSLLAGWGSIIGNSLLIAAAAAAFSLFIVFKDVCNGSCQIGQQDPRWAAYQKQTPKWIPKLPRRAFKNNFEID